MLKMIENLEEAELLREFSTDSFGLTVASLVTAYPPELDICRSWMQIVGDEMTAGICSHGGEIVLWSTLRADYEELAEFIKTIGYTNILCRARDVVSLELFACACGQVWRREPVEAAECEYEKPEKKADYKELFELLEIKGEFDEWFADISHRINKGTAEMRFIRKDGKIMLYKGGTSGASNTGNEPYSEYYAAQIAKALGVNAIEYGLSKWKGELCSTCELFTSKEYSFLPVGRVVTSGGMKAVREYYEKLGQTFVDALNDMLVLDAIIMNTDRHFGNFGFIVDNKTNKIANKIR